jgi:hypothetical protein
MLADIDVPMNINSLGEIGLLMFVVIFLFVAIWAFSRTRNDVHNWAEIPLQNDINPQNQSQYQDRQ